MKQLADTTSQAEIARLKQQNTLLLQLLESEKVKADKAKDDLIRQISTLLGNFTAERDRSLRETFSEMADSNLSAQEGMELLGTMQGEAIDGVVGSGQEWNESLEKSGDEFKKAQSSGRKVNGHLLDSFKGHILIVSCLGT